MLMMDWESIMRSLKIQKVFSVTNVKRLFLKHTILRSISEGFMKPQEITSAKYVKRLSRVPSNSTIISELSMKVRRIMCVPFVEKHLARDQT